MKPAPPVTRAVPDWVTATSLARAAERGRDQRVARREAAGLVQRLLRGRFPTGEQEEDDADSRKGPDPVSRRVDGERRRRAEQAGAQQILARAPKEPREDREERESEEREAGDPQLRGRVELERVRAARSLVAASV